MSTSSERQARLGKELTNYYTEYTPKDLTSKFIHQDTLSKCSSLDNHTKINTFEYGLFVCFQLFEKSSQIFVPRVASHPKRLLLESKDGIYSRDSTSQYCNVTNQHTFIWRLKYPSVSQILARQLHGNIEF